MKKTMLLLVMCTMANLGLAQEISKTVFGTVSDDLGALADVKISIEDAETLTASDKDGTYSIKANEGDVILFSRMGMWPLKILVEDVTRVLNVKMFEKVEQLQDVTVTKSLKNQNELQIEYMTNPNIIRTAFGYWDADATSFQLRTIDAKDINPGAMDLATVLRNRFPGMQIRTWTNPETLQQERGIFLRLVGSLITGPASYDIDGLLTQQYPDFIDPQNIQRIGIVASLSALTRYGYLGRGGVIVINTKNAVVRPKDENGEILDVARARDNRYFDNALDAVTTSDMPTYLQELNASQTEQAAMETYSLNAAKYSGSYFFFIDSYDYFNGKWKNAEFAEELITENWNVFENNPVALKSLAYTYQAEGDFKKANELYKEIFILRPHYAQSYLDLANSYGEIGEYQKSAAIYARYGYLLEEDFLNDEKKNFTQIMDRELNNLITLKGRDLLSKRDLKKFTLEEDFDGTRLVFEWADSEAEFELQFVNPQDRYFKWNHTMRDNMERIQDEKAIGFSTEEYLIDEALLGNWQVNVKYLGNKSLTPTYLKATVYHNYGSVAQRKETKVFKLSLLNVNQELFKVSNTGAVVSK